MSDRALVHGGGGSAGNAWEFGIIAGLFDAGLDVTEADLTIGTSAGSTAAAQVTSGIQPTELLASILAAAPQPRTGAVGSDGGRTSLALSPTIWSERAGSSPPLRIRPTCVAEWVRRRPHYRAFASPLICTSSDPAEVSAAPACLSTRVAEAHHSATERSCIPMTRSRSSFSRVPVPGRG
jgi:predicted acylesterase/phospholipase RssA